MSRHPGVAQQAKIIAGLRATLARDVPKPEPLRKEGQVMTQLQIDNGALSDSVKVAEASVVDLTAKVGDLTRKNAGQASDIDELRTKASDIEELRSKASNIDELRTKVVAGEP
ncbi:hypothetical protein T484DRAFT_1844302 [Baffinella frigidus]|nr:hypothetical protein T484DRAFT_1844302 [Cryptophyta sp. CCMP2293]